MWGRENILKKNLLELNRMQSGCFVSLARRFSAVVWMEAERLIVCVCPSLQSSQPGGGPTDSCEGSQAFPPTPPIMLQVNCPSITERGEGRGSVWPPPPSMVS